MRQLIDCEEDRILRAVLVGLLREAAGWLKQTAEPTVSLHTHGQPESRARSRGARGRLMGNLPRSPACARWVGVLHLRRMNAASTGERKVDEAKQAIAWLERSRWIRRERIDNRGEAWTQRDEFSDLMTRAQIAPAAVVAGDVGKAERYANEILRTHEVAMAGGAPTHVDWGARESYIAHIVLGKVVLARGEVRAASEHLRLASRAAPPSSPSLSTLGPDTELAAALLEQGEREAVVEYLTTMKDIWSRGARQLDRWVAEIKSGRTPDLSSRTDVRTWRP